MISHELKTVLNPFKFLLAPQAMNPIYRTLELQPMDDQTCLVRGCVSWGVLEIATTLRLAEPSFVNRADFLAIVQSLPKAHEFNLKITNGALHWTCGRARGKLAQMAAVEMPWIDWPEALWPYPADLRTALDLGRLSCHTTALAATGMYGIVVDQRDGHIIVASTDNASLSIAWADGVLPGAAELSTLAPDGVELLAEIMADGVMGFDDKAWYYADAVTRCRIVLLPAMKNDIRTVRKKYNEASIIAPIPAEALSRFIKRANALAEVKRNARVCLGLIDGRLVLSFKEGNSETDESFTLEALAGQPNTPEVELSAAKLARALSHTTEVVLDHAKRGVLMFRGHAPPFEYLLCGRLTQGSS
jgi:hypothetical protein